MSHNRMNLNLLGDSEPPDPMVEVEVETSYTPF